MPPPKSRPAASTPATPPKAVPASPSASPSSAPRVPSAAQQLKRPAPFQRRTFSRYALLLACLRTLLF
jgi:hypothetical protein